MTRAVWKVGVTLIRVMTGYIGCQVVLLRGLEVGSLIPTRSVIVAAHPLSSGRHL